jgi:hypothetical protein
MNNENLIASLTTLIDKNDPILVSLGGVVKEAEVQRVPMRTNKNDSKENINPKRRASALEPPFDKSQFTSVKNLLNEISMNGRRNSDTKGLVKNYTTDNIKDNRKEVLIFEDEIKEENEFDECDMQPHVNPTTRQQCKKVLEVIQVPKDKECTFAPNVNPIRKSSAGRKLQEYLKKDPYERLSKMVDTKVLNEKTEDATLKGSLNIKEVFEKRNNKKQIVLNNVKGEVNKKIPRRGSPKINEKTEESGTKHDSRLRNCHRRVSPNRNQEHGSWFYPKTNHYSRNAKSPSMHVKQTFDGRKVNGSPAGIIRL